MWWSAGAGGEAAAAAAKGARRIIACGALVLSRLPAPHTHTLRAALHARLPQHHVLSWAG